MSTGASTAGCTSCVWPSSFRNLPFGTAWLTVRAEAHMNGGLEPPHRASIGATTAANLSVGTARVAPMIAVWS